MYGYLRIVLFQSMAARPELFILWIWVKRLRWSERKSIRRMAVLRKSRSRELSCGVSWYSFSRFSWSFSVLQSSRKRTIARNSQRLSSGRKVSRPLSVKTLSSLSVSNICSGSRPDSPSRVSRLSGSDTSTARNDFGRMNTGPLYFSLVTKI